MPSSTRLRRALVGISTGAAQLVTLTSCTSFGTGDQDAARAAAEEHAHLVAAGDDLETLWATTLTAEPALVRDAGRMLGEASERIEVLHLSEAEPADMVLDGLYEADVDLQEARPGRSPSATGWPVPSTRARWRWPGGRTSPGTNPARGWSSPRCSAP